MTDIDYMSMACNLALKAKGQTSPNPLVGAVITKKGKIIAAGYHRRSGGDHAELIALKKAGRRAKGAKLYVTLEPCGHFGRTPPCVDRIIQSGIKEVIIGMKDPNPANNGRSIQKLKRTGIKTKVGYLEDELRIINESFIKYITTKMPFITAKCAQTLDGKIATASGQSKWITSKKSRELAHVLRGDFDAILAGINTVLEDNPRLQASRKSKKLKKVIIDSTLKIPLKAKLLRNTSPSHIFIATTRKANKAKLNLLAKRGINVLMCSGSNGKVNLPRLFKQLAKREMTSILIEGGGEIIGSALKAGVVDKMLIFIAPKIIGDQKARGSVSGLNITDINKTIKLKNFSLYKINDDILMEAYVYRNR